MSKGTPRIENQRKKGGGEGGQPSVQLKGETSQASTRRLHIPILPSPNVEWNSTAGVVFFQLLTLISINTDLFGEKVALMLNCCQLFARLCESFVLEKKV